MIINSRLFKSQFCFFPYFQTFSWSFWIFPNIYLYILFILTCKSMEQLEKKKLVNLFTCYKTEKMLRKLSFVKNWQHNSDKKKNSSLNKLTCLLKNYCQLISKCDKLSSWEPTMWLVFSRPQWFACLNKQRLRKKQHRVKKVIFKISLNFIFNACSEVLTHVQEFSSCFLII